MPHRQRHAICRVDDRTPSVGMRRGRRIGSATVRTFMLLCIIALRGAAAATTTSMTEHSVTSASSSRTSSSPSTATTSSVLLSTASARPTTSSSLSLPSTTPSTTTTSSSSTTMTSDSIVNVTSAAVPVSTDTHSSSSSLTNASHPLSVPSSSVSEGSSHVTTTQTLSQQQTTSAPPSTARLVNATSMTTNESTVATLTSSSVNDSLLVSATTTSTNNISAPVQSTVVTHNDSLLVSSFNISTPQVQSADTVTSEGVTSSVPILQSNITEHYNQTDSVSTTESTAIIASLNDSSTTAAPLSEISTAVSTSGYEMDRTSIPVDTNNTSTWTLTSSSVSSLKTRGNVTTLTSLLSSERPYGTSRSFADDSSTLADNDTTTNYTASLNTTTDTRLAMAIGLGVGLGGGVLLCVLITVIAVLCRTRRRKIRHGTLSSNPDRITYPEWSSKPKAPASNKKYKRKSSEPTGFSYHHSSDVDFDLYPVIGLSSDQHLNDVEHVTVDLVPVTTHADPADVSGSTVAPGARPSQPEIGPTKTAVGLDDDAVPKPAGPETSQKSRTKSKHEKARCLRGRPPQLNNAYFVPDDDHATQVDGEGQDVRRRPHVSASSEVLLGVDRPRTVIDPIWHGQGATGASKSVVSTFTNGAYDMDPDEANTSESGSKAPTVRDGVVLLKPTRIGESSTDIEPQENPLLHFLT